MPDDRKIHIGTSGWHYKHWKGSFYPEDMRPDGMFAFYCRRFRSVELNTSFYRLPSPQALAAWRAAAPRDFVFAMKGSRFITHMKKLKDPAPALAVFLERALLLKPHLGPILFQLPPRWSLNLDRLRGFLDIFPADLRCAFEFRDPSWFEEPVYRLLEAHRAAFCIYHIAGRLAPARVTTDLVYLRLHGPDGPYQGQYDEGTLARWAEAVSGWVEDGRTVYCYFDNDQAGFAAQDALRLQALLGCRPPAT